MKQGDKRKKTSTSSLSLLTDLYELTMAYGYWKKGMASTQASFYLSYRRKPFGGEYAVVAGLETFIDFVCNLRFEQDDIAYLRSITDARGDPLFEEAFLLYLANLVFTCDIDAMPEGSVCFAYEPMIRVTGPILQAQIIESALLNIMNFQTLIATKASRICFAADEDDVVEFGLRRAQGIDGAISASRAAYIGGCTATSNTLAGKLFGIPIVGTHAHSWIMAFEDEQQAFQAFADVFPTSCIFLIDTYDSILGVKKAIETARKLQEKGYSMLGVRLDSGDLSQLSIAVRQHLDEAGFLEAKIMASNELDEYLIRDLKQQGAEINVWGVGTNLVTGKQQPALDGVYKLSAIQDDQGEWIYKVKLSEQWSKVTNPGILQVRRYSKGDKLIGDAIFDINIASEVQDFCDPFDPSNRLEVQQHWSYRDLLIPIVRSGQVVYDFPNLKQVREYAKMEVDALPTAMRRFMNPQSFTVGLESTLLQKKLELIRKYKGH